ncbi:MAG TPA: hypothetical protein VKP66_02525 [Steroidobacteraceae bacterium]|nr:hypothetical protein [Steroidobacteraceae bacterium]
MSQVAKFPEMRPRTPPGPIHLPPPSGYVQRVPLFPTTDGTARNRRFERKRLLLWFGVAVAFHAVLLLGFWLMPALRIKWEPSPDAWVRVTSLSSAPPAPPVLLQTLDGVAASKQPAKEKAQKAEPPIQPRGDPGGSAVR